MLEKIREESQGFWAKVILGLIILTFAVAGVGSYINDRSETPIANVNGQTIGSAAFESAYQAARGRMENELGEQFSMLASDANYLRNFRQSVLEQMINEILLDQKANELGLRASDEQVNRNIVTTPSFQLGGEFDTQRFNDLLRLNGITPHEYRSRIRAQLTRQQLLEAVSGSEFALPGEAQLLLALQQQTRDLRVLSVSSDQFVDAVEVSGADIEAYYQANLSQFDTQEKLAAEYIRFSANDLLDSVEVSKEEIQAYYDSRIEDYRTDEKRNASHILIQFGEDESAAEQQAQDLLVQINEGADFAELAKQHSADSFTAASGGELGDFGKGAMDPAFEEAVFAMTEPGSVSDVVKSAFGFHIIKLNSAQQGEVQPLSEVTAQIEAQLKQDEAVKALYSLHEQVAQVAFEQPEHLDEVSALIGKPLEQTELFSAGQVPQDLAAPAVTQALFSEEAIEERLNSEVIEVAANQYLVFRVTDYQPSRTKSLEEVSAQISERLVNQKAKQAAREWADGLVASLRTGESVDAQMAEQGTEWQEHAAVQRFSTELDRAVLQEAFKLGLSDNDKVAVVDIMDGVAVVELQAVHAGETPEQAAVTGLTNQLADNKARIVMSDFVQALRESAEIEYLKAP